MNLYTFLRELADSWMLLAMFLFFVLAVVWAFRPGARAIHRDVAGIPFRNTDKPELDAGRKEALK